MATGWNGSGTFTRGDGTREGSNTWTQAKTASAIVNAADHDTHDEILADGIEACLAKNGENAMTGTLNMGSQSISNWLQTTDITWSNGADFTIDGDFQAVNGDFTGDLDVANTVSADFLTAADTVTTEILDVNVSSTFNGGTHLFTQNGTDTAIKAYGSLSEGGYLMHAQANDASDVFIAHGDGRAIATNFHTSIMTGVDTDFTIDMSGSEIAFKFGTDKMLTLIEDEFTFESGIDVSMGPTSVESLKITQGTPASASAPGAANTIKFDANYIYICTATNTWKRVLLSSW